ncbi:MAG: hypothetical protein WBQ78_11790 [Gammaproteobacteria bacterium]
MRKTQSNKLLTLLSAALMLFGSAGVSAITTFPALELNPVSVTGTASGVSMTGLAPFTLSDPTTVLVDLIPDLSFTLISNGSGAGSLQVAGGSALQADFANLTITYSSLLQTAFWNADLTYTGGSLAGSLTGGRVEGAFGGLTGFGDGLSLLGQDFSASGGIAKVGAVVPVPPAVWLFGSGLLGLVGVARRRSAA